MHYFACFWLTYVFLFVYLSGADGRLIIYLSDHSLEILQFLNMMALEGKEFLYTSCWILIIPLVGNLHYCVMHFIIV